MYFRKYTVTYWFSYAVIYRLRSWCLSFVSHISVSAYIFRARVLLWPHVDERPQGRPLLSYLIFRSFSRLIVFFSFSSVRSWTIVSIFVTQRRGWRHGTALISLYVLPAPLNNLTAICSALGSKCMCKARGPWKCPPASRTVLPVHCQRSFEIEFTTGSVQ